MSSSTNAPDAPQSGPSSSYASKFDRYRSGNADLAQRMQVRDALPSL